MRPLFDSEQRPPEDRPCLRAVCETRLRELVDALTALDEHADDTVRAHLESAVDAVSGLLTGDLDRIPPVIALQLCEWIRTSRHLGTTRAAPLE